MPLKKYGKKEMEDFLRTYEDSNYNLLHAEAVFREKHEKFSRQMHYVWIKKHKWYKDSFEAFEIDKIRESMDSARFLRTGVPAIDHNGNFAGWREKPHWPAIEKFLIQKGIYDDPKQKIDITSKGESIINTTIIDSSDKRKGKKGRTK